jgi:1-deoxy-D-xylulose 5-phosphate reductoisomerase
MKNITILGATGSIGDSTLSVKLLCCHSPLLKALWQRIHPSLPQT